MSGIDLRYRAARLIAGVCLAAMVSASSAMAQDKTGWPADFRKFEKDWETGTWRSDSGPWFSGFTSQQVYIDPTSVPPNPAPLNAKAQAEYIKMRQGLRDGAVPFDPDALCHPQGLPFKLQAGNWELQMTDDRILILYGNDLEFREIYMDGRAHPTDPILSFYGHSIGHFEGKTLVIDTASLRGADTQIEPHIPKSDESHLVERWTPVSKDRIAVEFTFTDPVNMTRPWVAKFNFNRDPKGEFEEGLCSDGNRFAPDATGALMMTDANGRPLEKAEPLAD